MRTFNKMMVLAMMTLLLILIVSQLAAQEKFSVVTGKVLEVRGSSWLDVQSDKDKAVFNFRVGRKTVYTPNRHPYPGERVKVEYLKQRGTLVGYTVTILNASK